MTVLLHWVGGQKEGEEKDGQKQHGVELLKRKEMERGGLQWERARQAAKDRKQWKENVQALCTPPGAERIKLSK